MLVQVNNNKKSSQLCITCPFYRESTGNHQIPAQIISNVEGISFHDVIMTLMVSCEVILHQPVLIPHRVFPKESHLADLDEYKDMVRQLENGKCTSGMKLTSKETCLLITVWELFWWHQSHEFQSYINNQHAKLFKDYKKYIHMLNCILELASPKLMKLYLKKKKKKNTCCQSYTANTMSGDALVALGASASAGMVLTPKTRTFHLQCQKS